MWAVILMLGLTNKAIENFTVETYRQRFWKTVIRENFKGFCALPPFSNMMMN
jgi:hypothetical protein